MLRPDDPGGGVPQPSYFVNITNDESSMDTDTSIDKNNPRKRLSANRKICKHCNKKRRHHGSSKSNKKPSTNDCHCVDEEIISKSDTKPVVEPIIPSLATDKSSNTPRPLIGRMEYNNTDVTPFVVHIQKQTVSPDDNATLHPITFGRFLKKNSFNNIINGSLKKIGRNKLSLSFSNHLDANSFIIHSSLASQNYKAFIPSFNVTRMGLVRGVPADWSDDDVMENITVPFGCGNILKVRRIRRKKVDNGQTEFINTESMVLTFDGQVLPKRVYMCYNALPVDTYIFPTIQCYNCCRYGHVKVQCRSKPRCFKCGEGHSGDTCSMDEDFLSCCLCSGLHYATNRKCPEYERQRSIKISMAKSCISYAEAIKLHPPISKSYADVLVTPAPHSPSLTNKYNNFSSHQPVNTSYKKTVFLKPRAPVQLPKGYDQAAHKAIINNSNISSPSNGCALINSDLNTTQMSVPELITALLKCLSHFQSNSPSNAAPIRNEINNPKTNNGSRKGNPVELPQHNE